mgnify:CR=1 FL=1|tara:strand:+ start:2319 stop:3062 length:744 start_codon:yes stop_codon:yes gene_type:complete
MVMEYPDLGEVTLIDHMGSDLTVVNSARVSFDKESNWSEDTKAKQRLDSSRSTYHKEDLQRLSDKDVKLINYLAKHNHWTPFAHPQITFRIKAPISIRTQMFKHKQGFVENEVSRRYVKSDPEWYHPRWRACPTNGAKQGSSGWLQYDKEADAMCIDGDYHYAVSQCVMAYKRLISEGVAPEQARFVLPQGCLTEWYWTGSLASYARFYKQRIDSHAQWEVQQFASAIGDEVSRLFPTSWEALTKEK